MAIFAPRAVVLYVDNVEISTDFYRQALAKEPLETFDGFVVFGLTEAVHRRPPSPQLDRPRRGRSTRQRRAFDELRHPQRGRPSPRGVAQTRIHDRPGTYRTRVRLHICRHGPRRAPPPRVRYRRRRALLVPTSGRPVRAAGSPPCPQLMRFDLRYAIGAPARFRSPKPNGESRRCYGPSRANGTTPTPSGLR